MYTSESCILFISSYGCKDVSVNEENVIFCSFLANIEVDWDVLYSFRYLKTVFFLNSLKELFRFSCIVLSNNLVVK